MIDLYACQCRRLKRFWGYFIFHSNNRAMYKWTACIGLWLFLGTGMSQGQSFSDLELDAYWSLTADASDSLGAYPDLELVNVQGPGPDGIFLNGNYIYGDPDSSLAATPPIDWDFDHLAVALEFKAVDSTGTRPIFVCGDLYRWLGVQIADGQLELVVNDAAIASAATVEPGVWHRVAVRWDAGTARLFLDGAEVATATADSLVHSTVDGDYRISNTHYGVARAFKGYWRRLQVWSGRLTTSVAQVSGNVGLKVWPNPATKGFWVRCPGSGRWHLRVLDPLGRVVHEGAAEGQAPLFLSLDASSPGAGYYVLEATDGKQALRTLVLLQ